MKSKKIMALFLSAIIIALTFSIIPAVEVSAATTQWAEITSTTSYGDVVLSYNDYNSAATYTVNAGGRCDYNLGTVSSSAFPTNDLVDKDGNPVYAMRYTQFQTGAGFIMPGNDFSADGDINKYKNPIEVKQGMQLQIDFDYTIKIGENVVNAAYDATGNWLTATSEVLNIGYVLLPDETTFEGLESKDSVINGGQALTKPFITIATGHSEEIPWTPVSETITVPENADLSIYKYLAIYITTGHGAAVYIDNVKVTSFVEQTTKTVLQDYENADAKTPVYADYAATPSVNNGYNYASSGSIFPHDISTKPVNDGHNKVINYRPQGLSFQVSLNYIGYDYAVVPTSSTILSNGAVPAEAGTYTLEFDYRVSGALNGNTLEIGVGSIPFITGLGDTITDRTTLEASLSDYQSILTHPKGYESEEWEHKSYTFTIPETKADEYLTLITYGGNTAFDSTYYDMGVLFDNVKLTQMVYSVPNLVKDTSLVSASNIGFDNMNATTTELNQWTDHAVWFKDAGRVLDPDDDTNKVVGYTQTRWGLGVIHPGISYKYNAMTNAVTAPDEDEYGKPIIAEAGATYKIDFQYKLKGKAFYDITFGMAVGSLTLTTDNTTSGTHVTRSTYFDLPWTSHHQEIQTIKASDTVYAETAFTNQTYYYTVPADLNLTQSEELTQQIYDTVYLQFYITGGGAGDGKVYVYIDNLNVTKVNGKAFTFTDENGETTYSYDRTGRTTYDAKADETTSTGLIWLNSSGRPFVLSSYAFDNPNTFEETKLTAVREKTDVAFSVGDADMDGVIADEDIAATRKELLNTTADSFSKLRADLTNDGKVDILDILTLKKLSKDALSGNATIGGEAISTFKLSTTVTGTAISELGGICTGNANTISVTVDDTLSNGHYIIEIKDTSVSIKAKTDAVADAAVETLLSYINAKMAITDVNSFEFIYTGN